MSVSVCLSSYGLCLGRMREVCECYSLFIYYLAMSVHGPEPDLGKAVVQTSSELCQQFVRIRACTDPLTVLTKLSHYSDCHMCLSCCIKIGTAEAEFYNSPAKTSRYIANRLHFVCPLNVGG